MAHTVPSAGRAARDAARMGSAAAASPWMERLARLGFVAKGTVYLVIGLLSAQVALGEGGSTTDRNGALRAIYEQPFGKLLLAVVTVGLLGYALWSAVRALRDPERKGADAKGIATRLAYGAVGLSYAGLALASLQLILGTGTGGRSSDTTARDWTARLLDLPFGPILVIVAGLAVAGVGVFLLYRAYKGDFQKRLALSQLSRRGRDSVVWLGRCGYSAQGIIFCLVGVFLALAAVQHNPGDARGVGGTLAELVHQPYGHILLGLVALGLIAFGAYSFVEARYRHIATG